MQQPEKKQQRYGCTTIPLLLQPKDFIFLLAASIASQRAKVSQDPVEFWSRYGQFFTCAV
jgi:hypothetical protein